MQVHPERQWSKAILMTAALYHLGWGLIASFIPGRMLAWMVSNSTVSPFSLQIIGIVTFCLGIAYALASFDPFRQWVVSVAGLVFSGICSVAYWVDLQTGNAEPGFLPVVLSNWVIWVPLLGLVVYMIYRNSYRTDDLLIATFSSKEYPLDLFDTTRGDNLMELTQESKVLLVFLRHFGCPFCKDTMDQIAQVHQDFTRCGTRVVLVYMVSPEEAREHLQKYNLEHLDQISDAESILYKKFRLRKGRAGELFGPRALLRFGQLLVSRGYVIGKEVGDSFQMPGVFLLHKGEVISGYVHESAGDRPNYNRLLETCCA
ncbi:MAG: redoxin domain-containing protein [Bacteroidetes bacterium]|nr:redoxin domain-containing protein [Bacteroidota bacterium]